MEQNSNDTLAHVFTDCRYTKDANEAMSATLAESLFRQGFLSSSQISPTLPILEVRPDVLECDVVRFQNKREKWVAFVGLYEGYPYEIFTGLMDDEEGIMLPKSVSSGRIIKHTSRNGQKRYDFQFDNKRGY